MITRIEAYRYRCFEKLTVDLGPYQVLVGRNGAGKSTLIDIPILLGEMFERQDINEPLFVARGSRPPRAETPLDVLFSRKGTYCALVLEATLPPALAEQIHRKSFEALSVAEQAQWKAQPGRAPSALRYELALTLSDGALQISHEYLFLLPADRSLIEPPAGLWGDNIDEDDLLIRSVIRRSSDGVTFFKSEVRLPGETPVEDEGGLQEEETSRPRGANVLLHIPALSGPPLNVSQFGACAWLKSFLGKDSLPVCLDLAKMRLAQRPPGRGFRVATDGTTLPWSVLDLEKDSARYAEWHAHMATAVPFLRKVEARQREDDRHAFLDVSYDTGFSVRSIGLSDGTLTFLALTILPFLRNVPALVTVEEPENGVHPKAIETILESLQVIQDSQVWITTHSPIVVAVTDLDKLLCLQQTKAEGVTIVRGSDHPTLKTWKGQPDLSVLFSAGVL